MIGVFGGTFDPVHNGHLRSAVELLDVFDLNEIRLIPCGQPPHRATPMTSGLHRARMLELAVNNRSRWVVDRREIERPGYSFMVDTLKSLKKDFPHETLLLAIGADAFCHFTRWHEWQRIFVYAHVLVMTRPGYTFPELEPFLLSKKTEALSSLKQQQAGSLLFYTVTPLDISASQIRDLICAGQRADFLLPDAVLDYIHFHRLYGS
jgi:nicotinate-nucleotide adenylyltransferase